MNETRPSRPSGGLSTAAIVVLVVVGLLMLRWVFGVARAVTGGLLWIVIIGAIVAVVLARRD